MWALIINGSVRELTTIDPVGRFNPALEWVSVPAGVTPAVGWSYSAGTFSAPPAPAAPTLTQQATALIAEGLAITSTGTPVLNGTYIVQSGVAFGQEDIANEAQFISTYSEFTNGATTNLSWPLLNGTFVTFSTTAEFLAFAKAVAQFIAAVKLAAGQGSALPAAAATIP